MMSRRLLIIFILFVVVLSACAQNSQPDSPAETVAPEIADPDPTAVKVANCIVQGAEPTPNPTVQAILPPLNESDHAKGPEDAYVTLIEYGDFQ